MLTKQAIDVSFAQGLDQKTDPKRVQIGKFVKLENSVFQKGGLLQKRNGYPSFASLPDSTYSYLTTFNGNLTAIGPRIAAFNEGNDSFVVKTPSIQPLNLSTQPVLRNNLNQTACDTVIAPNGLMCTVYLENNAGTITNKYVIADSITGQNITAPAVIPVASGTVSGGMRVFYLGTYFILMFTNTISASPHLQYVAISANNPTSVGANTDIAAGYSPTTGLSWDGFVFNESLAIAYNTTSGGQSVKVTILNSTLTLRTAVTFATYKGSLMSVTADITNPSRPVIYVSFFNATSNVTTALAVDANLNTLMAPTAIDSGTIMDNITSAAYGGVCHIYMEVDHAYSYDGSIPTNFIVGVTITGFVASGVFTVIRSVGLASKAFVVDGIVYFLSAYQSAYQPTYFLVNGSQSLSSYPVIAAKLAYENGGGYLTTGLPGVTVNSSIAQFPYLFKDLIQAVNKNTNVPAGSQVNGIYSQTGINLATIDFGTTDLDTAEIGNDLHISGGFLWMYDGYLPVEHNFFLWPDNVEATWSTSGGSIHAQPDGTTNTNAYYYQVTYEWTDNQGNAFRSAPSIPIAVTTTGSGSSGSITLNIPTLRLTMKTANPVKIVIYRWSVGQQNYYQTTSLTSPLLNETTIDSVSFVDMNDDATILGNNLLYTTGGVIEDVNAPASNLFTLFDTRLWLVDAEDPNLVWFSKQVIEATPVEMSDLLTMYIPPSTGTNISTGPITSIATMDDKILFGKKNAWIYVNGTGPDNTGANSQYSQPIFITSTVGCTNQRSIVLTPNGLMFQSDKGIWIIGRDLSTNYIGAPVEDLTTGATVNSAVLVPETNQVRFTLDTGITLMYDYYYGQWGTFIGVPALSSCIYKNMHTYINSSGQIFQETPGTYMDGSNPVLMMFQTGPLRLGDLQNYQRAHFFYLLGTFISPHKLNCSITYDYESAPSQSILISPTNYSTPYGVGLSQSPYGQGNPYGGPTDLETWRVFLERQRCMAFSIQIQELFDATYGTLPGAGLTLSGLNVICAFKKAYRPQAAVNTAG